MRRICFILVLLGFLGIACAPPKPLYYWGNYSNTLYKYKKTPNDSNLQKHKEELVKIIKKSRELGINVPPGVSAEYGFILLKTGSKEEAIKYFDLEQQTYPESKTFMEKLKSFLIKDEGRSR